MAQLVVIWLLSWIGAMAAFVVVAAAVGIAAAEVDLRYVHSSGLAALGAWSLPMGIYWLLCLVAATVAIAHRHSPTSLLSLAAIFVPGFFLGSAAVFLTGPVWASWRERSRPTTLPG
ncbi:MAG: hypothetical protein IPJ17_18450 [Holophagales bacterium]|nr:MAG: hypothetical protein IPJ17_18450 [Holophagales bacterium]